MNKALGLFLGAHRERSGATILSVVVKLVDITLVGNGIDSEERGRWKIKALRRLLDLEAGTARMMEADELPELCEAYGLALTDDVYTVAGVVPPDVAEIAARPERWSAIRNLEKTT